ncbi:MAG: stage III sporulation protein AB [Syntrophomonas sp.]|uniref:stage III sporulation protein AB n=1 Tax=Syntrophomonas sp. TaxID=2053627 RepID=UPI002603C44B|nr:stage III sporulation protein AB [Syntrophomonas sp.]MDD2510239.1 stage III sporulation protein AB [Syntrophomonas sp.]MDD3878797.1 stage III sporulation protein AB [Syntrophomonas sp.]MDD4626823.1 stage III sporulation protein AB [Syntrophomonas sp.]
MLGLKIIGAASIITGFGCWGLSAARRMDKRVGQLQELRLALGFLEKEISCIYSPLSQALARTAYFCRPPVSCLFELSSSILQEKSGITAAEAWNAGIEGLRLHSELQKMEIGLLATASLQLGVSEASQQKKLLTLLQEELALLEQKAMREAEGGRKMWTYSGFILGAMVVLLLI